MKKIYSLKAMILYIEIIGQLKIPFLRHKAHWLMSFDIK